MTLQQFNVLLDSLEKEGYLKKDATFEDFERVIAKLERAGIRSSRRNRA